MLKRKISALRQWCNQLRLQVLRRVFCSPWGRRLWFAPRRVDAMIHDNPAFCALPWFHFYTHPDGTVLSCCISRHDLPDSDGQPLNLQVHRFTELWNAPAMLAVRWRMIRGIKHRACKLCYQKESVGAGSYRTWANSYWFKEHPDAAKHRAVFEASLSDGLCCPPPRSFDLRLGNTCNLRCRTCNALFSAPIERDRVHHAWTRQTTPAVSRSRFHDERQAWHQDPALYEELKDFSGDVRFIQLGGGEPLLNQTQTTWIKHLARTGRARDINIVVWTNFTVFDQEFYEALAQFHRPCVNLSLCGHGATFEYIRHPARWTTLEQNLRRLRGIGAFALSAVPVLQLYNALTIHELFEWCLDNDVGIDLNTVNGVPHLDFRLLPPKAKLEVEKRLTQVMGRIQRENPPGATYAAGQLASFLKQLREELPAREVPGLIRDFMQFTNDLDQARGQRLSVSCPELFAAWVEHYGPWDASLRHAANG